MSIAQYIILFSEGENELSFFGITQENIQYIIEYTLDFLCERGLYVLDKKFNKVEIGVRLSDSVEIKEMNNKYRGINKCTNTLSFPYNTPDVSRLVIGDIVLAGDVICQEAQDLGKKFIDHLSHLVVHSTLHLAGYDHESDEEADIMEKLETEILTKLGIQDPY